MQKRQILILKTGRIYNKPEPHNTLEGICNQVRVGYLWRGIATAFDDWRVIYCQFNLKCKNHKIKRSTAILIHLLK